MKRDKWDKNQIFPSALETMTWSGKTWAMMQHPDIVFLWIGVSLLEENGVDGKFVPQTWPQLEEMANKLTKSRGDGWEFVGFLPHIGQGWQFVLPQANGAKLISDDGKKAQLDTAEVADAIEFGKKFVTRLGGVQAIDNWRIALPGGDNRAQGAATRRRRHLRAEADGLHQRRELVRGQHPAGQPAPGAAAEVQRGPLPQRPPRARATRRPTSTAGASWRWRARAGRSSI